MLAFFQQRWFLLALITVLLAGIFWPDVMQPARRLLSGDVIMAAVMFIMALPLRTGALWIAVRRPGPTWLATLVNSGVAPPLGWLAGRILPAELAAGLVVATTVPCTLASAAVWTRRAGGNDAVAFLVTMITNLGCFLVVPAWLRLLLGGQANANYRDTTIDYGGIVIGLVLLVVLPIIVGQLLRQWPPIGGRASRHVIGLSTVAQVGVLLIVFVGAVDCGKRLQAADNGSVVSAGSVILMVVAVAGVHVVLLALGVYFARLLKMSRGDTIAVAFCGSQKTLMVGAYLALAIGPLAILPMVAYHATQLVIDTLIADWLRQRNGVAGPAPEL